MMDWDPPERTTSLSLKRLLKDETSTSNKKKRVVLPLSKSRGKKNPHSTINSTTTTCATSSQQEDQNSQQSNDTQPIQEYNNIEDTKLTKSEDNVPPKLEDIVPAKLDEYACPICEKDLTDIKSSYLRQYHVEACITSTPSAQEEEDTLEFKDCIFCGKRLSHFNFNQRQVHLNNCLDEVKDDPVEPESSSSDGMFAGQHVPFLDTLEICPVCHEITPFINRTLKQKIQHTKQCARQNKLSLNQLLKKFQWIGWGHLPIASTSTTTTITTTNITSSSSSSSTNNTISQFDSPAPYIPYIPNHRLIATGLDSNEVDDDFSSQIIIHKSNQKLPKPTREGDGNNEELQTVLALSKSMMKSNNVIKKKRLGIRPSDERDWNAANIWSMEESRKEAINKLDDLLFSENELEVYQQNEREKSIGYLEPSRLCVIPGKNSISYWNLASNKESNWDDPLIFISSFLRESINA